MNVFFFWFTPHTPRGLGQESLLTPLPLYIIVSTVSLAKVVRRATNDMPAAPFLFFLHIAFPPPLSRGFFATREETWEEKRIYFVILVI